jgi:hypothetical protein
VISPLPSPVEVISTPPLPTPLEVISTPPLPPPEPARLALDVPLPMPRPAEAPALTVPEPPQPSVRSRRTRMAKPPAAVADNRSFFEKFFGGQGSSRTALAYAPANDASVPVRGRLIDPALPLPTPTLAGGTAVYDISARTVFLPNGEKLEAHSGLGDKLDDPRQVDVKMRGPTPPHVYDLTEREQPFHGVRALRLTPVGGSGAIHGREGLLAHTYMLGPRGDSNGCISFKDYNKFLQAYLRGDVKRLVVVAKS